jgi:hypothetical protein
MLVAGKAKGALYQSYSEVLLLAHAPHVHDILLLATMHPMIADDVCC